MYISYETIGNLPFFNKFKDKFYDLKVRQNLEYIAKNYKKVQKRLQQKSKKGPLRVVFYVYDDTKWKCQSLYDLLDEDKSFEVEILVTKNAAKNKDNPSYQTIEDVKKTYEFFANKKMNVKYAYDIKKKRFIPFKKFKPDIIIYQHPWYVETSQGPVVCSKFALTYYVPYYFPTTTAPHDYHLRFHLYIEKYCVFDEITKKLYVKKMKNHGKNVIVTGQPSFDYFHNNIRQEKEFIIYAPHWSICKKSVAYGTFEWNGKFLLDYAKKHPQQKWVFKPHPLLFKALIDNNIMSKQEAKNYFNEWDKIGLKFESGDYFDLFLRSKMMITDCSTFLGEYFLTENPLIHLISKDATPFNETVNQVIENYYKATNIKELSKLLEQLPENDIMKTKRINAVNNLGFKNINASQNILNDIKSTLDIHSS